MWVNERMGGDDLIKYVRRRGSKGGWGLYARDKLFEVKENVVGR